MELMRHLLWIGTVAALMSWPMPGAEGSPVRLSFIDIYDTVTVNPTLNPAKSVFLPDDFGANGGILDLGDLIQVPGGPSSQHYFRLYFDHLESGPVRADAPGFGLLIGLDNDVQWYRGKYIGDWQDSSWGVMGHNWTPDSGVDWSFLEPLRDPERLSLKGTSDDSTSRNLLYVSPRQGPGIPAPVPEPASLAAWGLLTFAGIAARCWSYGQRQRPAAPRS
jgi:hypothetical protein